MTPDFRARLLGFLADRQYHFYAETAAPDAYGRFRFIAGACLSTPVLAERPADLTPDDWWFGGLSYELKNTLEPTLRTTSRLAVPFPDAAFFRPDFVVLAPQGVYPPVVELWAEAPEAVLNTIRATPRLKPVFGPKAEFVSNFSEEGYLAAIRALKVHIREGDVYEINLTQAFSAALDLPSPAGLFLTLLRENPVPFAALFRYGDRYVLSASPERFLQHRAGVLTTQPIKGTIRRSQSPMADARLKSILATDEKFRAENVMIVDLARNDLNRSAEAGSVQVPKLFEVQTFRRLHHLVSTITGTLRPDVSPLEALQAAFPPGSMTGAPKLKAMELIDRYEPNGRGLYAGSLGYVAPGGDFDFNVVIRSLIYDAAQKTGVFHVGGAITYDSDPQAEYAESLLKAEGLRALFR